MPDRLTIAPFEFFVRHATTRFPFRYGIASMTDVPHVFLRTRVTVGAESVVGIAAEGLPPKWFTKDPSTTFDEDLPAMLRVIRHAATTAEEAGRAPVSFFDLWKGIFTAQERWAQAEGIAPLLANLGVSLIERAILDGICRLTSTPLHALLRTDRLGLRLEEVRPGTSAAELREALPAAPLTRCHVRHTVGLGDPLTPDDITPEEKADDGLPQDLESCIREYGLQYFKVKLAGRADVDLPRLTRIAGVLERETRGDYALTVDGNENFPDLDTFRAFWERAGDTPALKGMWRRVLVVEQPVHRGHALDAPAGQVLRAWTSRPAVIVDESDGALDDLPRALALGYDGTSHKNCKGIVKGLANACLLAARRREGRTAVLTGEDLCTLGPVALLQDLAMMALLGITHVERNGHHYYRGLSMLPPAWQDATADAHGDLYRRHDQGFTCLRIEDGRIALGTTSAAPFGVAFEPDLSPFTPLDMT